jgi:signal peptide peptidase SppA
MMRTCDPSALFGFWMCEPTRLAHYIALARGADLAELRAEAQAAAAAAKKPDGRRYELADGIALIELTGPLTKHPTSFQALFGGTSMILARAALRDAERADDVAGIMLRIDSPGGTVDGAGELAEAIRRAAAVKPLWAFADDLAASGGLLALAQASRVWAGPNAEVGSIGVYTVVEDLSGRYEQEGVRVHVISSAPPIKGAGVEGTEVTEPQLAAWRARVNDLADWFVGEVATGRRMPRDAVQKLATGEVWISSKAQSLGLVDEVATFGDALEALRVEVDAEEQSARALQARLEEARKLEAYAALAPPPARRRSAPPPLSPYEQLEAKAKAAGLDVLDYIETPAGAEAYRLYREGSLSTSA